MKHFSLFTILALFSFVHGQITEVDDINPSGDSNPSNFFIDTAGGLFFRADDGTNGFEPYVSDGNTTTLIKDINTTTFASGNSNPSLFIEFNNLIYFRASDGDEDDGNNETELWVTDGTEPNTNIVADINPTASANPQDFFIYNNELYFEANDVSSTQIWALNNGSPIKVTDNRGGGFASPAAPFVFSGGVYIVMNSGNGNNPHIFDGTTATELLDATTSTSVRSRGLFNNEIYFEGDDGSGIGDELWKTDGTVAGTILVKDLNSGSGNSDPRDFVVFNNELFFAAEDSNGYNLWKSDGTDSGTIEVDNPNSTGNSAVSNLFSDGTNLYYAADNGTNGIELWKYNATDGATMLKDINVLGDSNPNSFLTSNGFVFFIANDGSGNKLWVTNGTESGTVTVASQYMSSEDPTDVDDLIVGNVLYFSGIGSNGNELFTLNPSTLTLSTTDVTSLENNTKVYPNPSQSQFKVSGITSGTYQIFGSNGKLYQSGNFTEHETINHSLTSGVYIIVLETKEGKTNKKLIVQ